MLARNRGVGRRVMRGTGPAPVVPASPASADELDPPASTAGGAAAPSSFESTAMTESSATTPAELARIIEQLRSTRAFRSRPRKAVLGAIEMVIDAWLRPDSAWFARALAALPAATGFSPEMIRHALPTMLAPLRAPALSHLLEAEVGTCGGPDIILHVLPGNLPAQAAIPAALSLAIGSAPLLKAAAGDRLFPLLFAESIAERDEHLGRCIAACYWPGGDRACEDVVLSSVDLVVASGGDEAIADLSRRARGRLIGYGDRLSFAVITRDVAADLSAADHAASGLALDTAVWDQRGCLSPQLCLVEGDFELAMDFGARVFRALATQARELPPGRLALGDRLAIRRFRDEAEWAAFAGEPSHLFALPDEAAGTVRVTAEPALRPSPLGRTLSVAPLQHWTDLAALLGPIRPWLEAAGLAAPPERWPRCAEQLSAWGVHRVAGLGEMQRPPLDWRPGGRPRVGAWIEEPDAP